MVANGNSILFTKLEKSCIVKSRGASHFRCLISVVLAKYENMVTGGAWCVVRSRLSLRAAPATRDKREDEQNARNRSRAIARIPSN